MKTNRLTLLSSGFLCTLGGHLAGQSIGAHPSLFPLAISYIGTSAKGKTEEPVCSIE